MAPKAKQLTSIIELPLGLCLSPVRGRHAIAWLDNVAAECNRIRTTIQRQYLRWREDNPTWHPPIAENKALRDRNKQIRAENKIRVADGQSELPQEKPQSELIGTSENVLYKWAVDASPNVNTNIASHLAQRVKSELTARVPYNHPFGQFNPDGSWKLVRDALAANEVSAKSYRSETIPCPSANANFSYRGFRYDLKEFNKPPEHRTGSPSDVTGENHCCIEVPLWSKKFSNRQKRLRFRLKIKNLKPGHKRILAAIARSDIKFCDSQLVKKNDQWYLQMAYQPPTRNLGCNSAKTSVLMPGSGSSPFFLGFFDEHGVCYATRAIGNGPAYRMQQLRLKRRRKAIRYRYKFGARKGRGRRAFFETLRRESRSGIYLQDDFRKQAVADIVKSLRDHDCGTLLYREASKGTRMSGKIWFVQNDTTFNYTLFEATLAHKMAYHGINYSVDRLRMEQWRETLNEPNVIAGIALHGLRLYGKKSKSGSVSDIDSEEPVASLS